MYNPISLNLKQKTGNTSCVVSHQVSKLKASNIPL